MSRKRTRLLVVLLAAGTAAGVAGALVARRRSRSRWEEYESQGRASAHAGFGMSGVDDAAAMNDAAVNQDWPGEGQRKTANWAGSTRDANGAGMPAEKAAQPLDVNSGQFTDSSSTLSNNGRS